MNRIESYALVEIVNQTAAQNYPADLNSALEKMQGCDGCPGCSSPEEGEFDFDDDEDDEDELY